MSDDKLYLLHILACIEKIESYTSGGKEEFFSDEKTSDAVLRNLQVMAESTQRLGDGLKSMHDEIAWGELSGFRNILTHAYFDINLHRVWQSIINDLPALKVFAQNALRDLQS